MCQENPLTLLRGHPQLAHQNSYDQRCRGHQEKSQPADQNTDPTTGNIVNVISILNVTRYTMQVKRQHINTVMEVVERTHNYVTTIFNITSSIYTSINYQEILLHICSILASLRDSLYYIRQITMHAMDYIDAATTSILSPHVLPVADLWEMLIHIKLSYHQPCFYQCHQMTPFTSIDTCTPMFRLQRNNFYYWLMYLSRIMHNNLRTNMPSTYSYQKETCQHGMT